MEEYVPQEWSESGKRLLETIQGIIKENGGREKLYTVVLKELEGSLYKADIADLQHKILLLQTKKLTTGEIQDVLGISRTKLKRIMYEDKFY